MPLIYLPALHPGKSAQLRYVSVICQIKTRKQRFGASVSQTMSLVVFKVQLVL